MSAFIIGADEVGRGCLAGPLVVGAVLVPVTLPAIAGVTDSKKLSPRRRDELAGVLRANPGVQWALAEVPADLIDRDGIMAALRHAFTESVQALLAKQQARVVIDGDPQTGLPFKAEFQVRGDASNWVIGAASILAKVHRDKMMVDRSPEYPVYGWERNAGYGTAEHISAIKVHGLSPLHRATFCKAFVPAPVGNILDLFGA